MGWMGYKVILRLRSPLHIGAGQVGNVQRTRPYVSGRALWGALTARLTRDCPALGGDYGAVGRQVNEELAFSYFYPASGEQVHLWPWGEGGDEFAWRYLGSYTATALDHGRNAAQEGSLHEVEYVAPRSRDRGIQVSLIGYIMEREGTVLPWRQALPRLQLGGERGYGWGRVALAGELQRVEEGRLFDHYALELGDERPILRALGPAQGVDRTVLLAHALACDEGTRQAVAGGLGPVEPLVGRETKVASRYGGEWSAALICWAPGATLPVEVRVRVGHHGIWEAAP